MSSQQERCELFSSQVDDGLGRASPAAENHVFGHGSTVDDATQSSATDVGPGPLLGQNQDLAQDQAQGQSEAAADAASGPNGVMAIPASVSSSDTESGSNYYSLPMTPSHLTVELEEPEPSQFHSRFSLVEELFQHQQGTAPITPHESSEATSREEQQERLTPEQPQRRRLEVLNDEEIAARTHWILGRLPGVHYCAVQNQDRLSQRFGPVAAVQVLVDRAKHDLQLYELGTIPPAVPHPARRGVWRDTLSWLWGFEEEALRTFVWLREALVLQACENALAVREWHLARRRRSLEAARCWACVDTEVARMAEGCRMAHAEAEAKRLTRFEHRFGDFVHSWAKLAPLLRRMSYEQARDQWPSYYDPARISFQGLCLELGRQFSESMAMDDWERVMKETEEPDVALLSDAGTDPLAVLNQVCHTWSYFPTS